MSTVNIIFYSRTCNTCTKLLTILQNEGILSNFKLFCVDGRLNELPKQITIVPSMVIASTNKILVAGEIFEWLKNIKFLKGSSSNSNGTNGRGPIGWVTNEMSGTSDQFAYTNVDKAQPKSFFGVGSEEQNAIYTAPDIGKLNKKEQSDMIKNIESSRLEQDEIHSQIAKQNLNAILNLNNT